MLGNGTRAFMSDKKFAFRNSIQNKLRLQLYDAVFLLGKPPVVYFRGALWQELPKTKFTRLFNLNSLYNGFVRQYRPRFIAISSLSAPF